MEKKDISSLIYNNWVIKLIQIEKLEKKEEKKTEEKKEEKKKEEKEIIEKTVNFDFWNRRIKIKYILQDNLIIDNKIKESFFKYNFHIIEENNANYFEICNKKILLVQDQENSLKELDYANVNEKHVSYIEGRVTALSYTPILQIFIFAVDDDERVKVYKYDKIETRNNNENNVKNFNINKKINLIQFNDDGKFFLSSTIDYRIIIWETEPLKFYDTISTTAHNCKIDNLFFWGEDKFISLGESEPIKIWEKINNNYKAKLMKRINKIFSALLLNNNILVTCGYGGTVFYDLNTMNIKKNLINAKCDKINVFRRMDNKKLIIGYKKELKIISIEEMEIIQTLTIDFDFIGFFIIDTYLILLNQGENNEKKNIKIKFINENDNITLSNKQIRGKDNIEMTDEDELINDLPINAFITYSANKKLNIYEIDPE
jgi:WD40 repeat protein